MTKMSKFVIKTLADLPHPAAHALLTEVREVWAPARSAFSPPGEYPTLTSFVLFSGSTPVALCALILTNSDFAYLDGAVSNPALPPSVRLEALLELGNCLVSEARKRGFKRLLANTTAPTILKYAKIGFQAKEVEGSRLLELDLSAEGKI